MFWRTAVILALVVQPELSLVVATYSRAAPVAAERPSCCCCTDDGCPTACPCFEDDDTSERVPVQPTPVTPPARDHLLVLVLHAPVIALIADKGPLPASITDPVFRATPTARSLRTHIGVWQT